MSDRIEIREVIVCDDVRREDNGKAIIIGVYTGDLILPTFPAEMRLSFWLQGEAVQAETSEMKFLIEIADEVEGKKQSIEIPFNYQRPEQTQDRALVVFLGVPVKFTAPGHLMLSVDAKDGWMPICTKKIAALPTTSSISLPQPS